METTNRLARRCALAALGGAATAMALFVDAVLSVPIRLGRDGLVRGVIGFFVARIAPWSALAVCVELVDAPKTTTKRRLLASWAALVACAYGSLIVFTFLSILCEGWDFFARNVSSEWTGWVILDSPMVLMAVGVAGGKVLTGDRFSAIGNVMLNVVAGIVSGLGAGYYHAWLKPHWSMGDRFEVGYWLCAGCVFGMGCSFPALYGTRGSHSRAE